MSRYYTPEEIDARAAELFLQGKGLTALKHDPKCPPELKEKMEKLDQLKLQLQQKKGGNHGR